MKLTPQKKVEFLELLADGCTVTKAARQIGMTRQGLYKARGEDEAFAAAWADAEEQGTDTLEDEAIRRARDGFDKPVFQGGQQVGVVREHSDTLLIFMLKARRPEKFKDRVANEVSGPGGGPVRTISTTMTPQEAAEAYADMLKSSNG